MGGPATTAGPSGDDALDQAWGQIYPILLNADYSNNLFLSMKPTNNAQSCIGANKSQCVTSTVYVGQDFISAAEKMVKFGIDGKKLFIGDYKNADGSLKSDWSPDAALMNLALFLGQAMEETILYDVCDENSWDRVHKVTGQPFDFRPWIGRIPTTCILPLMHVASSVSDIPITRALRRRKNMNALRMTQWNCPLPRARSGGAHHHHSHAARTRARPTHGILCPTGLSSAVPEKISLARTVLVTQT